MMWHIQGMEYDSALKKQKTDKQMKNLDNPWKGMEETSMHIAK